MPILVVDSGEPPIDLGGGLTGARVSLDPRHLGTEQPIAYVSRDGPPHRGRDHAHRRAQRAPEQRGGARVRLGQPRLFQTLRMIIAPIAPVRSVADQPTAQRTQERHPREDYSSGTLMRLNSYSSLETPSLKFRLEEKMHLKLRASQCTETYDC